VTHAQEASFIKELKLEILTLIAAETNIDRILKEFRFYTMQDDKDFVAKTIQAIGKCALRLPEVLGFCFCLIDIDVRGAGALYRSADVTAVLQE
jgi:hypothetical protein